ncbi:MAG: ABC transporter substrate-binding protein [Thermodesulfobacteriota bacterium]
MGKTSAKGSSRREFLKTTAIGLGAVAMGGLLLGEARGGEEPIRIGMINALEGECAQWGIPITRGGQIWADEHNAQGGLLCGDGKRHPIEYGAYNDVCYLPNEELKAAKKAVLEDKKKYLFQTWTPSCRQAIAELTNQEKVLVNSYGAGYLSPKYPFLMGGITGTPHAYMAVTAAVIEKKPEIKRFAVVCTDESYGIAARWYVEAALAPYKDRVAVVYNKNFPSDLTEYSSLMGSVIKQKPDAIFTIGLPPSGTALLLEAADHLGYEGYWLNESWPFPHILKRVAKEKLEGRLFSGYAVEASVPGYSERAHNMYQTYVKQFGADDWIIDASSTYESFCTWEVGLQAAKSIDPQTVMETLYALPEIDHPISGKAIWGGMEIFGANYHLLTPVPIYVGKDGQYAFEEKFDFAAWWQKNKDLLLPVLKEGGQVSA